LFDADGAAGVVAGVGEDGEAFLDQLARGFDGADGVGEEGFLIAQDFELDPAGAFVALFFEEVAAEHGDSNGIIGGEAARGVGEDDVLVEIDEAQERAALLIDQAFAADGDGDDLAVAGGQRIAHDVVGGIFAGADEEAAVEGEGADAQVLAVARFVFHVLTLLRRT
jgi:hypothetical protein